MASPPEAAKPGGDNPSPPASDTLTPPSSPSPPTERSPPPSTTASPPSSTTETPPPPTTDSPPPPTAASPPPPPTTDSPPPPTTASPPPPTTASPPPIAASPPPPIAALPPPPTTVSPPPPDSSPPPQPSPDSPPPPKASAQSPPPPDKSETPPVSGPPPVFSPPADEGDRHKPPSPAVAHPPPAPPSKPTNGSPRSSPKDNPSPSSSDSKELPVILGIIFGGLVALILVFVILEWWNRRRDRQRFYLEHGFSFKGGDQYHKGPKQNKTGDPNNKFPLSLGVVGYPIANSDFSSGQYAMHVQSPLAANKVVGSFGAKCEFSYEALAAATDDFCQANLLGQGGFGFVHKGILPDGTKVAVKSLKAGSGQGEREFQAEVEIISRVHHRYLVSLVGYCIAGRQRMLVYEFVPNKTLEFHLHGKDQPVMSWAARRRIAVGSAKGLAYLHEDCYPRIIHRDIKAANILLDFNFEAKVADFGLAKLTSDNYTHVSTRVMGTFGYLAPEYAASGKLTEKSDVFSFGIMLLELITGRRPIDPTNIMEDSLVDWARPLMAKALETGDYSELVDPRLEDKYVPHEMSRMIACAAASIRHSARKRPRMSQIVRALDGNSSLDDLNEGVKPGESTAYNPYDTHAYNADILKFRKMVMSSEDFNSEATTDSGLNQSQGSSGSDSREIGLPSLNQKP